MEEEIAYIIDEEIKKLTYLSEIDLQCFLAHRIKPRRVMLSTKNDGSDWVECYLVTDHNGVNDSPFRIGYDPSYKQFIREVLIENDVSLYLGRYPDLESALDDFA
ncbi:hypothetical protein [Gallaecimonas mangrovi]|uniref:hypothetical protein n=1 Tax=Gallaecimonas mangrovi TaxID=2291597 RepID=UPI000E206ECB|nr:hypothetical protein [Gallaecimonas mangrovi]